MQQAEAIGLEGFLIKPVNPSVLFDTIMEVFGKEVPKGRAGWQNETSKLTKLARHPRCPDSAGGRQ